MELEGNENIVSLPANTEISLCDNQDSDNIDGEEEINGFGMKIFKRIFAKRVNVPLASLSSTWLLFQPSEQMKHFRQSEINGPLFLNKHNVVLAFGSLLSPQEFKCASQGCMYKTNYNVRCQLFFGKYHTCISINMGHLRFTLKADLIDNQRGVVIHVKSTTEIVMHVCLRGNLEEYALRQHNGGAGDCARQFYLQKARDHPWKPCFSVMHLSIRSSGYDSNTIWKTLCYFIQFFTHHSIPIHFGSIGFSFDNFIYQNETTAPTDTFISQYAWHMLDSVGCRIHDQLAINMSLRKCILKFSSLKNDEFFYYFMERLRRSALASENYFLRILEEALIIVEHYTSFYQHSIFHQVDATLTDYVRIPWFCLTPTRLIVKPLKFMRSNRVFRYFPHVRQCMAFVEFRDDNGSAYLPPNFVPFLKHYLENGFHFGGRDYIYLHHAQSQIRNKQFYFYCEREGGMTREALERWMGNFDGERLPAKNTARRTQPFSSTQATIEIEKERVATIPDIKTRDKKYNFTDGVGQISSELNRAIHAALGLDAEDDDYISSVLQIRYGGCKGTVSVNPRLDGKSKQLLIRPSMNKFECNHQMLELCKRSLKRRLCLNYEVINLLTYRKICSERLMVYQLRNVLWLITALVSNRSALEVLREKVLRNFSWTQISPYIQFAKEPFFHRILHTTISNNLHQLVTRAHIRVPQARYMFGVVDEFCVLKHGEVFVQITDDNGEKIVLEGSIAITKNPCRHPGDLRVLKAVNKRELCHLYDVLVFPQQGARPHPSEISGSDLDGDEYTVIWDPDLVPTSSNATPYNYDSGPAPEPLDRVVNRNDRLNVILGICEQDNLGRLSNIHSIITDLYGIDSRKAISLAGALSEELDSVKSGQHPYTSKDIADMNKELGGKRPDFMQTSGYEEYQSNNVLGKLFRSVRRMSDAFSKAFPSNATIPIYPNQTLLHDGYEEYLESAQKLYEKYQLEMWEIISSYGFTNEIDLFCCVESRNVSSSDRSDIQQTVQPLLRAVFQHIRSEFWKNELIFTDAKSKVAACYYVAYHDTDSKNKQMLSFPWLFTSQLLVDCPMISEDEETIDYMETKINKHSRLYQWLRQEDGYIFSLLQRRGHWSLTDVFEQCFQLACDNRDEQMITLTEMLVEKLIESSKTI